LPPEKAVGWARRRAGCERGGVDDIRVVYGACGKRRFAAVSLNARYTYKRQVLGGSRLQPDRRSGHFGKTTTKLVGRGDCASYADGLHVATAWIHGETTVESLDDDIVGSGRLFPANHRSTSDRSHPPETCFPGNRPLFVQRKRVDRLTPTTRSTSAVLILWSSGANRSRLGAAGSVGRGVRTEEPHGPKRRGSCRGRATPSMPARRLRVRGVSFEDICSTDEL
jgi:hypothetical protein